MKLCDDAEMENDPVLPELKVWIFTTNFHTFPLTVISACCETSLHRLRACLCLQVLSVYSLSRLKNRLLLLLSSLRHHFSRVNTHVYMLTARQHAETYMQRGKSKERCPQLNRTTELTYTVHSTTYSAFRSLHLTRTSRSSV